MKRGKQNTLRFTGDDLENKGYRETSIRGKSLDKEALAEARDGVREESKRAAMKAQRKKAEHAAGKAADTGSEAKAGKSREAANAAEQAGTGEGAVSPASGTATAGQPKNVTGVTEGSTSGGIAAPVGPAPAGISKGAASVTASATGTEQGKTGALKGNPFHAVTASAASFLRETLHGQINSRSDDNAGVQAANEGINDAGRAVSAAESHYYSKKMKASAQTEKLDMGEAGNTPGKGAKNTGVNGSKSANEKVHEAQKRAVKKSYAGGVRRNSSRAAGNAREGAERAGKTIVDRVKRGVLYIRRVVMTHPVVSVVLVMMMLLIMTVSGALSSCTAMIPNGGGTLVTTSYTSEDVDILGANEDYIAMQQMLAAKIRNTPHDHPGYDEYRYDLDEIGHDPYHLASYLTVIKEAYMRGEVSSEMQELFDKQYSLTYEPKTETRTRQVSDGKGGTKTVSYTYKILIIHLRNIGVDGAVRESGLDADKLERYEILNETKGNRKDLFAGNVYVEGNNADGLYDGYRIPGEALSDARFAAMIAEAEKYLGMKYVWGGSSPDTGFDCSGFVCYVINHSGNGNVGRTTANGLYNLTARVSREDARPGDLVFFRGTYNTSGASHVGIYVGNGMMLHCGNPVSYASINTNYWQNHMYGFGRLE